MDMFTEWVEDFPYSTERVKEVVWVLITEIIPWFGLPKNLQSDNNPASKAEVTQGLSGAQNTIFTVPSISNHLEK
jgi:hypothetical protein